MKNLWDAKVQYNTDRKGPKTLHQCNSIITIITLSTRKTINKEKIQATAREMDVCTYMKQFWAGKTENTLNLWRESCFASG